MSIKTWATRYLERGWNTIPVGIDKKPAIKSWKDYQTRMITPEEISAWPDSPGLALVTGKISGVTIVDRDGESDFPLLTPKVRTVKGFHDYYKYTDVLETSVRSFKNTDIRNDGGYAILPPSLHQSGKYYLFLSDYRLPLPEFPRGILDAGRAPTTPSANSQGWLEEAFSNMQHGNMDDTFTRVCGKLRYSGFNEADAFTILTPWIEKAEQIHPPANKAFLRKKITHIWTNYEAKPSLVVENEEAESVSDIFKSEEEPEWIVPGLVSKNSIAFFVGLPESNKTWITMDLAIEAARGGDWLGLFPVKRTSTLFIDQERHRTETKRRFKLLLKNKGLANLDDLHFKLGSSIKIDLDHSYNGLVRLLEKVRPELVIIDSLATIHTKEENSRSEIQAVMEKFKILREQFGCTFLFISHSNKYAFQAAQDGKEPGIQEMAGSIALPAAAETVFTIQKAKGGGSKVYHTKSTLAQKSEPFGVLIEDTEKGVTVRGVRNGNGV